MLLFEKTLEESIMLYNDSLMKLFVNLIWTTIWEG